MTCTDILTGDVEAPDRALSRALRGEGGGAGRIRPLTLGCAAGLPVSVALAAAGQGVALAAAAGWSAGMVAILAAALISARRAGPASSAAPAVRGGRGFAPGRLALR